MILITADLHLHEWQPWSHIMPDGTNSRLHFGIQVFEHMLGHLKDRPPLTHHHDPRP